MTLITLRVLDGPNCGQTFSELPTPLTLGREEGNPVQLNDERISRFHLKIQEDQGQIVLTDLESTNGTRVNGETVQVWNLRPGDVISVGRSVLVFGSRDEMAERLAELRGRDLSGGVPLEVDELDESESADSVSLEFELALGDDPDALSTVHTLLPPELPRNLTPAQAAALSELLHYLHISLRGLLRSAKPHAAGSDRISLSLREWQRLIDLQERIAGYLRAIGEPGE